MLHTASVNILLIFIFIVSEPFPVIVSRREGCGCVCPRNCWQFGISGGKNICSGYFEVSKHLQVKAQREWSIHVLLLFLIYRRVWLTISSVCAADSDVLLWLCCTCLIIIIYYILVLFPGTLCRACGASLSHWSGKPWDCHDSYARFSIVYRFCYR